MEAQQSKVCFKCHRLMPIDQFYRHQQMADGHLNKCKECTRRDVQEARKRNIVHYRNYDFKRALDEARVEQRRLYMQTEAYKESHKKALTAQYYDPKNLIKRRARYNTRQAIKDGRLVKQPCEVCGSINVQCHHEDYSNPLNVIWLCPKHHRWIHK